MSNLLKQKCSLAKLREELEGRKGKLCQCCKKFRYLARNCRNKKKRKEGTTAPQNKFEILRSRVLQCGVEERMIRRIVRRITSSERKVILGFLWLKVKRSISFVLRHFYY